MSRRTGFACGTQSGRVGCRSGCVAAGFQSRPLWGSGASPGLLHPLWDCPHSPARRSPHRSGRIVEVALVAASNYLRHRPRFRRLATRARKGSPLLLAAPPGGPQRLSGPRWGMWQLQNAGYPSTCCPGARRAPRRGPVSRARGNCPQNHPRHRVRLPRGGALIAREGQCAGFFRGPRRWERHPKAATPRCDGRDRAYVKPPLAQSGVAPQ